MRLFFVFFAALALAISLALPSLASTGPKKPHQILMDLKHEMILAGERNGSPALFEQADDDAAAAIADYVLKTGDKNSLIERDREGMTPLMAASFDGYDDVVKELLEHKIVQDHLKDVDVKGVDAWTYANFALKQSLWLCNTSILQNERVLRPIRVVQPYYAGKQTSPYQIIRRTLEAAGVKGDMEAAKKKWAKLCTLARPDVAQKVAEADDLQATLIAASKALPIPPK
jgi:ankyrin repeat protein